MTTTGQALLREVEGIVFHLEVLAGIVIVAEYAPREVRLVLIGQRQSCAERGRRLGTDSQVLPVVGPLLAGVGGVVQALQSNRGLTHINATGSSIVDGYLIGDILLVTLCVSVDVQLLGKRTADESLGTQREMTAQRQVEVHAHATGKLSDMVALNSTVDVGNRCIGVKCCLGVQVITSLGQQRHPVVPVALRTSRLHAVGEVAMEFGVTRHLFIACIYISQAAPGLDILTGHIVGKTSEVLSRHSPDAQTTADTDILIKEVSTLGVYHRCGTELDGTRLTARLEIKLLGTQSQTHGDGEERRRVVVDEHIVAQQTLALEEHVANGITQLSGHDTDTGTRHDVGNPVAVVQHTHHTCCRSHTVTSYRPPGRTCQTILLVQQGSAHEGRCRMT